MRGRRRSGPTAAPVRVAGGERGDRVALVALALLTVMLAAMALGAGGRESFLVPATRRGLPASLSGPLVQLGLGSLTGAQFLWLLVGAASATWRSSGGGQAAGALGARGDRGPSRAVRPRAAAALEGHLQLPELRPARRLPPREPVSARARGGPHDAVYRFVGWRHVPSAYGPLFTIVTYPLAHLGPATSLWAIKVGTALAGLGAVALVWRCAERLGRAPLPAAMWVGLNPLWLAYGIGGGHNDVIMLALTLSGVALVLAGRSASGGVALIASAAVKASSIVALPFMLLRDRRPWRELAGVVAGVAVVAALSLAVFGTDVFRLFHILSTQQQLVSGDSIPAQLTHVVGLAGVTPLVRFLLHAFELGAIAWLLWRVWRGADWIAGIGWAMLVLVVSSTWMLGWYTLWPLPFAALSNDRRLRFATLSLFAYFVAQRWTILLGQG